MPYKVKTFNPLTHESELSIRTFDTLESAECVRYYYSKVSPWYYHEVVEVSKDAV